MKGDESSKLCQFGQLFLTVPQHKNSMCFQFATEKKSAEQHFIFF